MGILLSVVSCTIVWNVGRSNIYEVPNEKVNERMKLDMSFLLHGVIFISTVNV
jgi:hypothetical protein